jgi:hypothetical protein
MGSTPLNLCYGRHNAFGGAMGLSIFLEGLMNMETDDQYQKRDDLQSRYE